MQGLSINRSKFDSNTINVLSLSGVTSLSSLSNDSCRSLGCHVGSFVLLKNSFRDPTVVNDSFKSSSRVICLKLYCRYLYTRPCMINHIWCLKQLWLQVNGHAWFHLQRLRWPVRNGKGAKNSKWKYMPPAGFEPIPRQSTTGKLQRLRPLGHEGLMVISG